MSTELKQKYRIAIIGGGSFGTAIANMVAENGHRAVIWLRNTERAREINEEHFNSGYLPGCKLSERVTASTDLEAAVTGCQLVFMCIPSSSSRDVARRLAKVIAPGALLISTTKGIEAEGFHLMSQVLQEEIPNVRLGVMSGPNLAKEIAARQLAGTVIASEDAELVEVVQKALHTPYFRVYGGEDLYGVELAGALKNIYAIMAGMAAAMDLGQNTIGLLLTRALAEMSRFAVNMGANPLTFIGLAGVGDLIVTCMSPLSRNYRVGYALGEGKNLQQIVAELGQVAEGVNTLKIVKHKADELDVYMPLVQGLYAVIHGGESVAAVINSMMSAEQKGDVVFAIANNEAEAGL
ncbi:glycerol-3-phosphate dehydrogenase (NAD(P)+) [Sinobacterium caligoides]|uniref:Glycerol-3-phosphate dehydrogenase [NAD(P)+] n=1 Tax=Sinobacterium caligoides TaxID=933926 RepID=A0A3N2DMG1_9GAMM|nr:NAD(P)H-dependent glycerol-3-phosphate dehydrogenase [Sinobacterium caligoides]ROS01001.1 glycerol-3-phosphate dehydrogenase (NAD(P)+) [Sinobacterium caligoides]